MPRRRIKRLPPRGPKFERCPTCMRQCRWKARHRTVETRLRKCRQCDNYYCTHLCAEVYDGGTALCRDCLKKEKQGD